MATYTDEQIQDLAQQAQIGIICPLTLEAVAVRLVLDEDYGTVPFSEPGDDNIYRVGRIHRHIVLIATLPDGTPGITTATETAKDMLRSFSKTIRVGLVVGIAGGNPAFADVRLGDIVVSLPGGNSPGVIQYDWRKVKETDAGEAFERLGSLNIPPASLRRAVGKINEDDEIGVARISANITAGIETSEKTKRNFKRPDPETDRLFKLDVVHPVDQPNCTVCRQDPDAEVRRPVREKEYDCVPMVHYGTIASGNAVVKSPAARQEYSDMVGGALCFEMESAGLMNNFPCLAIRGICDYADSHKNDVWQRYSALAAAAYAKELLRYATVEKIGEEKLAVAEVYKILERIKDKKSQSTCLASLATCDYTGRKNVSPEAVRGTCEWVLQSEQYLRWRTDNGSNLLWISADPGCGKSVLSRYLVDVRLREGSPNLSVCHFFFKRDDNSSLATALSAILHQLFEQQPDLVGHIMQHWDINQENLKRDVTRLWEILQTTTSDSAARSTICVLDALDECDDKDQAILLANLMRFYTDARSLDSTSKLKFFVTSRPYENIENGLAAVTVKWPHIRLEDEKNSEIISDEINMVIQAMVSNLCRDMRVPEEVGGRIVEELSRMDNRTYLWVHLVIDDLRSTFASTFRPEGVAIPQLPRSVEDAYSKILQRVVDISPEVSVVLKLVAGARCALNTLQMGLVEGLATKSKKELRTRANAYADPRQVAWGIRQRCGLFVVVHNDHIYLTHQTARDFLIQDSREGSSRSNSKFRFTLTEVEEIWARVCIDYLLLDPDPKRYDESCWSQCLKEYASQNWASHLGKMSASSRAELDESVYRLYTDRFDQWRAIFWEAVVPYEHIPRPWFASHAAAFNGHTKPLKRLSEEGKECVTQADEVGTTALLWSSWSGQYEASKLLLSHGADVNAVSERYGTPLLVAALKGHDSIVQLLLDHGANIDHHCGKIGYAQYAVTVRYETNYVTSHVGTALWAASLGGHFDAVALLLQRGATGLDFALMSACRGGNLDVVRLLVDRGANLNARDEEGIYGTPVQAAAMGGHLHVLEFLFERGAEDEAWQGKYNTAINTASVHGHGRLVEFLLQHAEDGLYSNHDYSEALKNACYRNDLHAVKALAPLVNDIDAPLTIFKQSALFLALCESGPEVVQTLLRNGADVHSGNPLPVAASLGYAEAVRFLVQHGANVNEGNPLMFATCNGHVEIVKLLVEKDADVDEDRPLLQAASRGYLRIAKILAVNGADVDDGFPMAEAARNGHVEIVKLLIDEAANVDGGFPLLEAARAGHSGVVSLLLKNDADINGGYPLAAAAGSGHGKIVKQLIKAGANVDGGYPLHAAIRHDHRQIAVHLIEEGANVNAKCGGDTALDVACAMNVEPIIRYLSNSAVHIEQDS
ncbi:ankyrin repeat-containing domain protein [Aspergillus stella-maris]|uniref:ankyrin repeat-containing domain protein n=1 Tax=Aspergillus stella-maris TaxID=1810926 RepID=UPI003CCDC128